MKELSKAQLVSIIGGGQLSSLIGRQGTRTGNS